MSDTSKTALITGASKRLGLNTVKHLHQKGFNILLHHRSSNAELTQIVDELNQIRPDSVQCVACDLNDEAPKKLIEAVKQHFGRLDVLINNASSFYPTSLEDDTLQDWDVLMQSNLKTPYFLSKACAPLLKESRGCIVNMIDIYHARPLANYSIYTSAKSGLAGLTKSLALELSPDIRVNGVSPGAILWPEGESEEHIQKILAKIPMQTIGHPDDIAKTILFLLDAPYITGQIIAVDGGRSLMM